MGLDRIHTLRRADALVRTGQLAEARECLVALAAEAPDDWSVVQAAADLCRRTGRARDAVRLWLGMARHFARSGVPGRAEQIYEDVRQLAPDDRAATFRLAELASAAGDRERARLLLAEVVQSAGVGPGPSVTGAPGTEAVVASLTAGRFEDARMALVRLVVASRGVDPALTQAWLDATARDPGAMTALAMALSDVCLVAGDASGSVQVLREFLARAPGEPEVLRHLVAMALEAGAGAPVLDAQAELAEALLQRGCAADALSVAEDLVARLPDTANRARLERVRAAVAAAGHVGQTVESPEAQPAAAVTEGLLRDLSDALEALGTP